MTISLKMILISFQIFYRFSITMIPFRYISRYTICSQTDLGMFISGLRVPLRNLKRGDFLINFLNRIKNQLVLSMSTPEKELQSSSYRLLISIILSRVNIISK
jgi:hypothetical protein